MFWISRIVGWSITIRRTCEFIASHNGNFYPAPSIVVDNGGGNPLPDGINPIFVHVVLRENKIARVRIAFAAHKRLGHLMADGSLVRHLDLSAGTKRFKVYASLKRGGDRIAHLIGHLGLVANFVADRFGNRAIADPLADQCPASSSGTTFQVSNFNHRESITLITGIFSTQSSFIDIGPPRGDLETAIVIEVEMDIRILAIVAGARFYPQREFTLITVAVMPLNSSQSHSISAVRVYREILAQGGDPS